MHRFLIILFPLLLSMPVQAINFAQNIDFRDLNFVSGKKEADTPKVKTESKQTSAPQKKLVQKKAPAKKTVSNTVTTSAPMKLSDIFKRENLKAGYYQQFLGPTLAGPIGETYNVFQEGMDRPGSGRAPLQSFHLLSLRYDFNQRWGVGLSLAATNGYTEAVTNNGGVENSPKTEFFNTRATLFVPSFDTRWGTLYSSFSFELPTSSFSRENDMIFGWVIAENFAFKLPVYKWSAGILGQIYRMHYHSSYERLDLGQGNYSTPIELQTLFVSIAPYVNYRFNDYYQLGSTLFLDWDQRGLQEGSREFNNNLPHRLKITGTYFPNKLPYLTSVGVFTQTLLKFSPASTAIGGELALAF